MVKMRKKLLMSFYEVNITLKPDEECTHKKGKNIDQSELLIPILKSYIIQKQNLSMD